MRCLLTCQASRADSHKTVPRGQRGRIPVSHVGSVLAHVGHVGNGGIQAHSCGKTFPFYVLGIGGWLCAFDPEKGRVGCLYSADLPYAYDKAEEECRDALVGLTDWVLSLSEAEDLVRAEEQRKLLKATRAANPVGWDSV